MKVPGATKRVRLQRFLSDAGVSSRKHAEEVILSGRVLVNGKVVDELPAFVDPLRDTVVVDGAAVRPAPPVYYLVYKPKGVVSGQRGRGGHRRVADLLPPMRERLLPAGELDAEDSGLVLMTNDGRLVQRLSHPRAGVPRIYWVETKGRAPDDIAERLKQGVYLAEGKARALKTEVVFVSSDRSILHVTLREARHRQVRRMLARVGLPVRNLKCIEIGPLKLKGLPEGAARQLSAGELKALRLALSRAGERAGAARSGRRGKRGSPKTGTRPGSRPKPPGEPPPRRRIIT